MSDLPARSLGWRLNYYMHAVTREVMLQLARAQLRTRRRQLILIDPDLYAFNGHQSEFCDLLIDGLTQKYRISVYCKFNAVYRVIAHFRARPIFFDGLYFTVGDQNLSTLYAAVSRNFIQALGRMVPSEIRSDAIFFMPTVTQFQLGGLAGWYAQLPEHRRPTLILIFHFALEWNLPEAMHAEVIERARSALASIAETGKVRIAATTSALAQRLTSQLGLPCEKISHPIRWPRKATRPPDPGAVFGFFGGLRLEKGAALLAEAIPRFLALYPDSRFIVHAPAPSSDEATIAALQDLPQVDLVRRNFTNKDEYFRMVCRAGCVLLPYKPAAYVYRASANLIEARGLGRLVIVTAGLSLEGEHEQSAGTFVMSDFTVDALLQVMTAARQEMLTKSAPPVMNQAIVSVNSAALFCHEIEHFARSG